MVAELKRFKIEDASSYHHWGCVIIARSKRKAMEIAFRAKKIPAGACFTIEVLPNEKTTVS